MHCICVDVDCSLFPPDYSNKRKRELRSYIYWLKWHVNYHPFILSGMQFSFNKPRLVLIHNHLIKTLHAASMLEIHIGEQLKVKYVCSYLGAIILFSLIVLYMMYSFPRVLVFSSWSCRTDIWSSLVWRIQILRCQVRGFCAKLIAYQIYVLESISKAN